jgi:poly(3-hydroxybutyrate) depolymerase
MTLHAVRTRRIRAAGNVLELSPRMSRWALVLVCAAVTSRAGDTARPVRVAAATTERAPLVVVLHGDREDAEDSERRWRDAVEARGWELLALECPKDLGCRGGSWYRWDGDPAWLRARVLEVTRERPIDTSRIFLVGWSGGATYIGKHLQSWPPLFAATVIHGGGVPPIDDDCPDQAFPAYFLVGDKNPAHGGARRLRAYFARCEQENVWDLVPGANHAREDAALTAEKADEILDWLARHPRALETS